VFGLLAGAAGLFGWTGSAAEPARYRPDRILVMPAPKVDGEALAQLHGTQGRRVLSTFPRLGGLQVVQLAPGETVAEALFRCRASGLALFAEPDYKLRAAGAPAPESAPNDPFFTNGTQWSLRNSANPGQDISAVRGWETLHSASNIIVAVVDSGIRYTHEDLAPNMWVNPGEIPGNGVDDDRNGVIDDVHGINAVANTGDPMDDAGHGSHVAGILGAAGNNGKGIAGVAWQVQLMACKFLDSSGDGDTSDAIRSIDYARRMGAKVINASFGGEDYSAALFTAISNARATGIILVASAGNESVDSDEMPTYPAGYNLDNIVSVGGTSRADAMDTGYSNFGATSVDLFAPGTSIYSTWADSDSSYRFVSGTSMASPHVAGILALMQARFTGMNYSQLIRRLLATVDRLPGLEGRCQSGGRANLFKALGPNPAANFTASAWSGEAPFAVSFTNLSVGEIASWKWDFGDGSRAETGANPTHVYGRTGRFPAALTITGANGATNRYEQAVTVTASYEAAPETYAWIDPAAMTPLALADNGASEQALPFAFRFYSEERRSVLVGANGLLGFAGNALSATDNTALPNGGQPNGLICPYWDNLNPAAGGMVYAGVAGEEPRRKFVASWVEVPRNSSTTLLTFQAILEEETSEIVFQYWEVHPEEARGGGKRATVGLESPDGTQGTMHIFNGSPTVLENESAMRFRLKRYRYLAAQPAEARFVGVSGSGFRQTNAVITLENTGNLELEWSAEAAGPLIKLAGASGKIAGGKTALLEVQLTEAARGLPLGTHPAEVLLTNLTDGIGVRLVPVVIQVEEPRRALEWASSTGELFSGGLGGPFLPAYLKAHIRNSGNMPLTWRAEALPALMELSPAAGSLEPGEMALIQIRPAGAAADLLTGTHAARLLFSVEGSSQGGFERTLSVRVKTRLEQAAAVADGLFRGELRLPPGTAGPAVVEASQDLVNWEVLRDNAPVNAGAVGFEDAVAPESYRFYRLRIL